MQSYRAARESGANILSREKNGGLAEAIDVLFDRTGAALPHFISKKRSFMISLIFALVIFILGLTGVLTEKKRTKNNENPVVSFRWIVMLGILMFVCAQVQDFVADQVYTMENIRKNYQHFTNVWWIKKYKQSLGC